MYRRGTPRLPGVSDKTRRRLLGNGWHWGIAGQMLLLTLVAAHTGQCGASEAGQVDRGVHVTWLQRLAQYHLLHGIDLGPGPRPFDAPLIAPDLGDEAHWTASWTLSHPLLRGPQLEPGCVAVVRAHGPFRQYLLELRLGVVQEIRDLVEESRDDMQVWLDARPSWVRATSQPTGRNEPFNALVFTHLLRELSYPDLDGMMEDLSHGFNMVGLLRRDLAGDVASTTSITSPFLRRPYAWQTQSTWRESCMRNTRPGMNTSC